MHYLSTGEATWCIMVYTVAKKQPAVMPISVQVQCPLSITMFVGLSVHSTIKVICALFQTLLTSNISLSFASKNMMLIILYSQTTFLNNQTHTAYLPCMLFCMGKINHILRTYMTSLPPMERFSICRHFFNIGPHPLMLICGQLMALFMIHTRKR